ncbi:Bifunctional NAD(P)H-hydrate repair enzyme Nnr [Acaryochloris thomasi RCC1774]|uniref:NAD(P)H-hydrate epimerase n=1 Tax=Acaryochloris thomasi RCC1774 TaxID=1764569 RepID=A0A2W1JRM5_9CYAN|nr:NAD(P)H-hydrate epimerase [Acaryochloris thomasi]PZD72684.1 Bifunctional NAD(P)H-hydrate repair enzyme Nnr [Acaryochloris thomasi RCC1774]
MELKFFTDTGLEIPSVTAEQMIEVDRVATEETGPNLFQMMENAGRNLALQAISTLNGQWQQANIIVLAGSGGNGGGGICAARHLANRGANVKLCLSSVERLKEVPAWQRRIFQATNGQEIAIEDLLATDEPIDLILDALIGYSLRAAPRGNALDLIEWANRLDASILSLDIPSGVDSTTGDTPGAFIHAQGTMTLALPKTGLLPERTGELTLADIGIPAGAYAWKTLQLDYLPPFGDRYRIPLTARDH